MSGSLFLPSSAVVTHIQHRTTTIKGLWFLLNLLTLFTEYHNSTLQCIWASSCQCSLFKLCSSVFALNKWLFEWMLCRGRQQHCLVCTLRSHPRACASMLTVCLFFYSHWLVSQTNDHKSTFLVSLPPFLCLRVDSIHLFILSIRKKQPLFLPPGKRRRRPWWEITPAQLYSGHAQACLQHKQRCACKDHNHLTR